MKKYEVKSIVGKSNPASIECLEQDVKSRFIDTIADVEVSCTLKVTDIFNCLCQSQIQLQSDLHANAENVEIIEFSLIDAKVTSVRQPLTTIRLKTFATLKISFEVDSVDVELEVNVTQMLIDLQVKVINGEIEDHKSKIVKPFSYSASYVLDDGSLHKRRLIDSQFTEELISALNRSIETTAVKSVTNDVSRRSMIHSRKLNTIGLMDMLKNLRKKA